MPAYMVIRMTKHPILILLSGVIHPHFMGSVFIICPKIVVHYVSKHGYKSEFAVPGCQKLNCSRVRVATFSISGTRRWKWGEAMWALSEASSLQVS